MTKILRITFAAALALTLSHLATITSRADSLDLRKLKCAELAKGSSKDNTTIAVWLNGYYMNEDSEAVIDFDKLNDLGNALVKYCSANPDMAVADAAEKLMGKGK